jgi:hypothetical protein
MSFLYALLANMLLCCRSVVQNPAGDMKMT